MALRKCHRWIRSNWRKFHKMCLLELEWSLPCLGMVHIRTSGETRDSFLEGINCLANTAAVQPFCVNVCVKNRICQFGELGWNHSILPVFFFLHNIYSCSLPWLDWVIILVIVSCETQHDSHCTFQCFSNMKKKWLRWGRLFLFCVTCHSILSSDQSCWRYMDTPSPPPLFFYSLHLSLSGISPPWGCTLGHLGHQWEYSS